MNPEAMVRQWWWFVIRGVLGIGFGVLTFLWPISSLTALVLLFGAYALTDGVFNLIAAARGGKGGRPWWALLLHGLLGVAAGIGTLLWPGITALALLYVIAVWSVLGGVFAIIAAVRLRKEITGEVWLGLSGLLSIVFGVLLMFFPGPGALALVLWIGAFVTATGIMLLALGFRLRGRRNSGPLPAPRPA